MKINRILFAGKIKGRIFTEVITTNALQMYTVTAIRKEGRKSINVNYATLEQAQKVAAKMENMMGVRWGFRAEAL